MATTTTVDLASLIPAAVVSDVLEAYYAATTLEQLAERNTTLEGVNTGDSVKIGSFGGATPALNLTETEVIVPKKFAAASRSFTVGRIGDGYEYSYRSARATAQDLQARSTLYLGRAAAQRIDLNLAATILSSVKAERKITATGTGSAAVITPANFIAAVRTFTDEQRAAGLVAVLTQGQRQALSDTIMAGGTTYAGQTIWQTGELNSFYGVPIRTDTRLAETTTGRAAGMFLIPGRTLVSAFAQDPLIEFTRVPASATINAWMNAWHAGGVQDLDALTVIDAAR